MTQSLKKVLVESVLARVREKLDATTSTCIEFNESLTKLNKRDLWNSARAFGMFDEQDIGDYGEIEEMEDIWADMVEKSVKYNFPNFRMV